ncbi:uncharacterized protein STEHIDRAFT_156231 [Stereum hirsutum FP-91666 SS1]|uniref:uncharacterized protein n=1 Tax=Stereum hirsutum (strain FP-91666) TaxID=721885 RepID=UPI000440A94F|nr:uncharacterized protein STEHIDRAFT_156231 [Stereum hirsutum FP-91666 SS1]EIM87244.1 hypothetical protein STEHIDRAFT_156231 [Stereum hirsutum FP-91666 SS1]
MSQQMDYVIELNNYCQSKGLVANWNHRDIGTGHQPRHVMTLILNNEPCTTGEGGRIGAAKSEAARQFLQRYVWRH